MGKNNPLKNKNGVTMVEMIVVFALISIFVAMSGQVIGSAMNIYHRIQGVEYGKQVSDTIMNKIVGELSGAQVASAQYDPSGATDPYTIKIDSANSSIEFRNEGGSLVKIYSGRPQNYTYNDAADTEIAAGYDSGNPANWDHQLVIHYYVTKGATGETVYQPVDWTFDKSMYHGYEIQSLNFSRADYAEYPWHIIRVDLKLKSNTYGEYETTRYVECYHFRNNPDKILEEGNPLPVTPVPEPDPSDTPEPDPSDTPEPDPSDTPDPDLSDTPEPTVAPTPTPTPQPDTNGSTFPVDVPMGYWPGPEDPVFEGLSGGYKMQPGSVFQWNGGYYVVTADNVEVWKQWYRTPDEQPWGVVKWSGRVITFENGQNDRSDLQFGDLCKVGEDWYIYTNYSSWGTNPAVNTGNWYKIEI